MSRRHLCTALAIVAGVSGSLMAQAGRSSLASLQTRAERTNFTETSRYDDVKAFLDTVDAASDLVHVSTFGYTFEGRPLLLAVVGRVADARPATVLAANRLRVYLQANIHAGEVEGKEAVLALVRDIARGQHADWLSSMVLLVNPNYNADGNEKVTLTSRGFQHGPIGGQGTRANAQGLNINRDDIKLETPEARSMVRLLNDFDPHVMIDLHTTNGSRHAYHLTYETPNNPAVDAAIVARTREWLAGVSKAIKSKDGWDFRSYGNVSGTAPNRVWTTVEDLPRYTHNYWGMRNRFGILSETYSYLPFADRVTTNRRFLEEVLGYAHANAAALKSMADTADATSLVGQRAVAALEGGARRRADRDPDGRCRGRGEPVLRADHAQAHERADARADGRRDDVRLHGSGAGPGRLHRAGRAEGRGRAAARARHRAGAAADGRDTAAGGVHRRRVDDHAQAVREPPGADRDRRVGRRSSARCRPAT